MALTEASPINRLVKAVGSKFKVTLKAGEDCKAGDALGYSSGWMRALATVATAIDAELIALEGGVGGDEIEVAVSAVLGGFTGGTAGGSVYQAEGTASGEYTETAPATTGDVNTIIGVILSATEILLFPGNRAPTTSA